jgi:hypothetical protein
MKRTLRCADLTRTDSTAITMAWDVKTAVAAVVVAAVTTVAAAVAAAATIMAPALR